MSALPQMPRRLRTSVNIVEDYVIDTRDPLEVGEAAVPHELMDEWLDREPRYQVHVVPHGEGRRDIKAYLGTVRRAAGAIA